MMASHKVILVILFPILLLVDIGSCDTPVNQVKISADIIDSYRSFSYAILRDKFTRKVGEDIGVTGYSTIGLGRLLAVVNEQVWDVDAYGFDNALKTPKSRIYDSYQQILGALASDPAVTIYSDIYTSRHGFKGPVNLEGLQTKISYVDYNSTTVNVNSVVAEINSRIAVQTYGKIYGTLVPEGGWWGLPFFNYTQGVFTNTFHYKATLANALRSTLQQSFGDSTDQVTFFESTALPLSSPKDKYVAVRIPFKLSSKSLVLILPKNNGTVVDFVKNDLEGHLRKVHTNTRVEKTVRIRIPQMNFTNIPTSFFRQLKKLGITESFCRYDVQKKNVLESVSQNVHLSLSPDWRFQVAVGTGSHMNNVENFLNIHNSDLEPQIQQDPTPGETLGDGETNKEMLARLKSDLFSEDSDIQRRDLVIKNKTKTTKNKNKENNNESKKRIKQTSTEQLDQVQVVKEEEEDSTDEPMSLSDKDGVVVNFNKPFFYYLDDDVLGPIFYGSVTSFHSYKKHEQDVPLPGQEWQNEGMKYLFWSCP